jgi:tetratricopeptide (TPR) repeat protein
LLRESLDQALALNLPFDVARAYFNLADQLLGLGRLADALDTLEAYRAYGIRVQSLVTINYAIIFLALVEWLSGQWARALTRRPQIIEWIEGAQSTGYHQIFGRTLLGLMDNDMGQVNKAGQTLESSLSLARSSGVLSRTVPYLGQLARVYSALGLEKETVKCVKEILGWFDRVSRVDHIAPASTIYLLFSCQWLAACESPDGLDEARACLQLLELPAEQTINPVKVAILSEGQGRLALAEGNHHQAIKGLRRASDGWKRVGRPLDQVRALNGLGQALAQAGDAGGSRTAFDQALGLVGMLATELEDPSLKASFFSSPLVQALRDARATLNAFPMK